MKIPASFSHPSGTFLSLAAAALLCVLLPAPAPAQTLGTQVSGAYAGTAPDQSGYRMEGRFTCTGAPTCTGQFTDTWYDPRCTNGLVASNVIVITGLNLTQSGPISGTMTLKNWNFEYTVGTGQCAVVPGTLSDVTRPYAGNWNASTGTASISIAFFPDWSVPGTLNANFAAPPAPVFPMTVVSRIDAVTANATAAIQFRPQDVGTSGRVYVFAVAPASQVKMEDASKAMVIGDAWNNGKADPTTACVLAQLNSAGQLQAATPAQLQAALSGVLTSAGATVPIMTNASTPAVASATFYVGYGTDSSAMLTNGIYRNAITVPGASVCPMVSSQTALWWNPAEAGWGLNLNHQGNILFGTLFTYDASGVPLWLVMSKGEMQSDGLTFTGDLYRTTGPAFNANPFTPIDQRNLTRVGTMTVSFQDVNSGTLRYTVNGVEVAKAIQRQVYGTRAAACFPTTASRATATNYQDLWWNAPANSESGWGINITHQDNTLFATLFTYDASGRDLWLVMSSGNRQADGSYSGTLYRTSGPPFNANPFNSGAVGLSTVGTMSLRFADGNNGTLTYTYNGSPVTKQITRQLFSSPVPLCN
jgi:hypothetical protein